MIVFCGEKKFPVDFLFLLLRKTQSPALTVPTLSHLTSCTSTNSNLYLANSLAAVAAASNRDLHRILTFEKSINYEFRLLNFFIF